MKLKQYKPKIGITGPDKGGFAAWLFTAWSVRLVGGNPVRIRPAKPQSIEDLDGLIIGGGADVDPNTYTQKDFIQKYLDQTLKDSRKSFWEKISSFFGQLAYPFISLIRKLLSVSTQNIHQIDKERDHLELQLIHEASEKSLPMLGICRGAQLLNVYFKGSLHQDINVFYLEEPNPRSIFPVKEVWIKPDSKLAEALQVEHLQVNALHHQAVKETGQSLEVVAQEKNQVVQGIESTQQNFVLGVQWHPEFLIHLAKQRLIFKTLVEQAKKHVSESKSVENQKQRIAH